MKLILAIKYIKNSPYFSLSTTSPEELLDDDGGDSTAKDETPTNPSRATTPGAPTQSAVPPKRKKAIVDEALGDNMLVKSLQEIQERARERRAEEDMDLNFALEIAGRLKRLNPRQNAYVKLQVQQLLFNVEFGQDTVEPYVVGSEKIRLMAQNFIFQ